MAVTLETLNASLETILKEQKSLRKVVNTIRQHIEDPTGEKAKARSENNGFKKPLAVSPELRAFLKLGPEERISRADVTKRVSAYCEQNSLKKGQLITLDEPLKALLNPPPDTQITFLNIQKYINHHFVKEPKPEKETKRKATEEPVSEPAATPRPKVAKKAKA
jgi:upstream activation factor subunit UAF30